MAEPGAAGSVLLQHCGTDCAIDKPHRHLDGRACDGRDHRNPEAPPHDRGDGQQVHHLPGQPGKTASQHLAHRGRYTRHRGTIKRRTLRREQPGDLSDEERVARGAVVHRPDQHRRRLLTAHHFQQLADLARGQACELHQLGLPGQLAQQPPHGMIADRHLHVAIRPDDKHGGITQMAGEEHQQPQRGHVRPMEIIDHDNHRPLRRLPPQIPHCHVVGAEASRGLIAQDAAPSPGGAGELGQHGPARLLAAVPCQRPHNLDPRPKTRSAVSLPARPPNGDRAPRLREDHRLGGERGLAHASLTRNQHHPARTPDGGVDGRTQHADAKQPPHQHVYRHPQILAPQAVRAAHLRSIHRRGLGFSATRSRNHRRRTHPPCTSTTTGNGPSPGDV